MVEAARAAIGSRVVTPEDWALGLLDGLGENVPLELIEQTETPAPGDLIVFRALPRRSAIAEVCYTSGPVQVIVAVETGEVAKRVYGAGDGMVYMSIRGLLG